MLHPLVQHAVLQVPLDVDVQEGGGAAQGGGGAPEADAFLRFCAVLLQEYAADTDLLARISDQSFVLLTCSGTPQAVADRLLPLFQRARAYSQTYNKPFEVRLTAGICPLRAEDRDLNELIFRASQEALAQLGDRTGTASPA